MRKLKWLYMAAASMLATGVVLIFTTLTPTSADAQLVILAFDYYLNIEKAMYADINFVAISPQYLPEFTAADKDKISAHYKEMLGADVIWATHQDLIAQGKAEALAIPHGVLFAFTAPYTSALYTITVDSMMYRGGLGAVGSTCTFVKKDGKWVLAKHVDDWIA
ncbi:MAG: hypothetical protein LBJ12_08310 [Oscillospiraceae bacterium]|jgi:hypothetical protein|nr:hypothetical protein [Oscillospiraceae bacterium]